MCAIMRDEYGAAEVRLVCTEGALGTCDDCEDTALVRDEHGARCASHVTVR